MHSELARCRHSFSLGSSSAAISVLDEKTLTLVGSKNLFEKNGWTKIEAHGFDF